MRGLQKPAFSFFWDAGLERTVEEDGKTPAGFFPETSGWRMTIVTWF